MKAKLRKQTLEKAAKGLTLNKYVEGVIQWKDAEEVLALDLNRAGEDLLSALEKYLKTVKTLGGNDAKEAEATSRQLTAFRKIKADPHGQKIGTLEGAAQAMRVLIEKSSINRLLMSVGADGAALLYVVDSVQYHPPEPRYDRKAYVSLDAKYIELGKIETLSRNWASNEVRGKTAGEVLNRSGLALVNAEALSKYETELARFHAVRAMTGEQFTSAGIGFVKNNKYGEDKVRLLREGRPVKLVIDDQRETGTDESRDEEDASGVISKRNWEGVDGDDDEFSDTADEVLPVPIHPFIVTFDLGKHRTTFVHIAHLEEYQYDPEAAEKLVLPADVKDLLGILIDGTEDLVEDIIKGKSGGVIVLQTGPSGVGKTLSAEVYAENKGRPLYTVQCAQLGTNPDELEQRLQEVLKRASRWEAILLLDEADVFIHERGDDVMQNAIVGVFLRVLEYFGGIMFMTSNRGSVIDDAIKSRCLAHVEFPLPGEMLPQVWETLAAQFKVDLKKGIIPEAVKLWPEASGRDVKNMLRLASRIANRRKTAVDIDLLKFVYRFKT